MSYRSHYIFLLGWKCINNHFQHPRHRNRLEFKCVPVVCVGLLSSSIWKTTPLTGSEVCEAVLLPVVVGALVQTDLRLRLHLLVAIPKGFIPPAKRLSRDISS